MLLNPSPREVTTLLALGVIKREGFITWEREDEKTDPPREKLQKKKTMACTTIWHPSYGYDVKIKEGGTCTCYHHILPHDHGAFGRVYTGIHGDDRVSHCASPLLFLFSVLF